MTDSLRPLLLCCALACGGSSEPDSVLEAELEAEETQGDETPEEHERHENERRVHASQSSVYTACYENADDFPEHHRHSRLRAAQVFRERMLEQPHVDDEDTEAYSAVEVSVEEEGDEPTHDSPASEHHDAIEAMEAQLDAMHEGAEDISAWSIEKVSEYERIARELTERCRAWAAEE